MAWNEPGGGKDRDPWGGGGDQGPPDLDEAFKKMQERLNGLFGGGSGRSGGGGAGISGSLIGVVLVVAVIVWGLFGFYKVDQQERAVVLRFGVYHDTVGAGLQWNPPLIDRVAKVNVTRVQSAVHRGQMLTEDENIVDVALSVQYRIADPKFYLLKVRNPERSLEHAIESALRHVVGSTEMDLVITEGRAQIAIEVQERLQHYLDNYETGIAVASVNIDDATAPAQVQDAFDDVTRAKEDKTRLQNEAEAYANAIIPEARGAAQRQIEEANAYRDQVIAQAEGEADRFEKLLAEYKKAPEVTRERLYIDAVQEIYSNTSKVMVDVEGGNNMLYLPLDKIIRNNESSSSDSATSNIGQTDIRELAERVAQELRRDNQSRREGR